MGSSQKEEGKIQQAGARIIGELSLEPFKSIPACNRLMRTISSFSFFCCPLPLPILLDFPVALDIMLFRLTMEEKCAYCPGT
jgi:hypothetical protein